MQLYNKYLSLVPFEDPKKNTKSSKDKDKEPTSYLCLDNLYFKRVVGEEPKMVLFTDGMLIEFRFEEEKEMMKWMNELTKYCVKMSLDKDYKMLDLIGKGGFGKVYKARRLEEFKPAAEEPLPPPVLEEDSGSEESGSEEKTPVKIEPKLETESGTSSEEEELVGVQPGDIVAVKVVEKGRIKTQKNYVSNSSFKFKSNNP